MECSSSFPPRQEAPGCMRQAGPVPCGRRPLDACGRLALYHAAGGPWTHAAGWPCTRLYTPAATLQYPLQPHRSQAASKRIAQHTAPGGPAEQAAAAGSATACLESGQPHALALAPPGAPGWLGGPTHPQHTIFEARPGLLQASVLVLGCTAEQPPSMHAGIQPLGGHKSR